ncbi:MAG TPA: aldehyde dehydrogenase (NADP(+)) [Saprospiraceae bacterium]|nr:aldehyde dehydrogenase (NADP(+)) [Saprospiraceae bacterium]HMQ83414.1 aldehyde dehydrogenase (NADP(+)) [Saprospiraceae bacterium]
MNFTDATPEQIDWALQQAQSAFEQYRNYSLKQRADFMRAIAQSLLDAPDELIYTAMEETHLNEERLRGERSRTVFQLNSYADACEKGQWLDIRMDSADPNRTPPKPDLRKMLVPLGPVVVFGSSNFPFAYSTAGGDTACALAAGCSVLVKAHPAHSRTSTMVARIIEQVVQHLNMPTGIFQHMYGASYTVGEALVKHPLTQAVGFTGSFKGGKQIWEWGNQREQPIPVFAEMGSTNPVYLFPEKLKTDWQAIATAYCGSITLGAGQFCTNPGLIVGIKGADLEAFAADLGEQLQNTAAAKMLHPGIAQSYRINSQQALEQDGVEIQAQGELPNDSLCAYPILARVSAKVFLENPVLKEEVFGPYSLIITCEDKREMQQVAHTMVGQLTSTIMATEKEITNFPDLVAAIQQRCGRLIFNGVPTGVEVCLSQHHGGPFPAATDSRFTSVGADGIRRFARPVAFQNWPDELLPPELQNANPLGIWRTVNSVLSR